MHLTTCWMLCNIMGWGGVGMMTFRAFDNFSFNIIRFKKASSFRNPDLRLSNPELQWELAQHFASP